MRKRAFYQFDRRITISFTTFNKDHFLHTQEALVSITRPRILQALVPLAHSLSVDRVLDDNRKPLAQFSPVLESLGFGFSFNVSGRSQRHNGVHYRALWRWFSLLHKRMHKCLR